MVMKYYPYIAVLILGGIAGFVIARLLLDPVVDTVYKEHTKIETRVDSTLLAEYSALSNYADSLEIALGKKPKVEIRHIVLRDTILAPGYVPKIQAFSATFPLLYGNAYLEGEVLGEVRKTSLRTDFRIPVVTNTITTEKTAETTIIQKGIFVGGGFSNQFDYQIGAAYLGNGFMANVDYTPRPRYLNDPLITANIKINLVSLKKK